MNDILDEVFIELQHAQASYAPMHSAHEGYAILKEELDELWDEIKKKQHDPAKLEAEARQVAAMAIRFINDVCRSAE